MVSGFRTDPARRTPLDLGSHTVGVMRGRILLHLMVGWLYAEWRRLGLRCMGSGTKVCGQTFSGTGLNGIGYLSYLYIYSHENADVCVYMYSKTSHVTRFTSLNAERHRVAITDFELPLHGILYHLLYSIVFVTEHKFATGNLVEAGCFPSLQGPKA